MSEAVTQFQAQAYKELLPSSGPVRTRVLGMEDDAKINQAQRVQDFMNYMITEEMEELTQYIMELSTYMAGITVALGIQESNGIDEWMKTLKAQREALGYGEEVEEKAPIQFELELEDEILTVDFIPEFDLDDN